MNNELMNLILIPIFFLILLRVIWVFIKGHNVFGIPPINPYLFIVSKILTLMVLLTPIMPGLKNFVPLTLLDSFYLLEIGKYLYLGGLLLLLIAFYNLNLRSLMMGIPTKKTQLQTKGLYRISRNPLYLSLFIIMLGSVLITQNLIIFIFSLLSVLIHHQIILKEEIFLSKEFDYLWQDYQIKVKRYLGLKYRPRKK